jgi:hypothetical protein
VGISFSVCEFVSPDDRVTNLLVFQLVEITQVPPLPVQSSGESLESRPGKLPSWETCVSGEERDVGPTRYVVARFVACLVESHLSARAFNAGANSGQL